jgi:hypothetical protein
MYPFFAADIKGRRIGRVQRSAAAETFDEVGIGDVERAECLPIAMAGRIG